MKREMLIECDLLLKQANGTFLEPSLLQRLTTNGYHDIFAERYI